MWLFVNNLIKVFIPFGLFIWAVFMPRAGGYTFIGVYITFQAYLFYMDSLKPNLDQSEWTPDEIEIIRKYHLALKFPFGTKDISCLLNGFRWIGLLFFTPLFLWNHMWTATAVAVVGFVIMGPISISLDPFFFLGSAVNQGQIAFAAELALLRQVSDKLYKKKEQKIARQQSPLSRAHHGDLESEN